MRLGFTGDRQCGLPDYKNLATQKLRTAEDHITNMLEQLNPSAAFVLKAGRGAELPHIRPRIQTYFRRIL